MSVLYTNNNGKMVAAESAVVPAGNGAFRYGISLFETMLVQDGKIRLAAYHWERLFAGIDQLQFRLPPRCTAGTLEAEVLKTVQKNQMTGLCRVRLQVYADGGSIFGMEDGTMQYLIQCYPVDAAAIVLNENGLVAGIAVGLHKSDDSLSHLKTGNALVYAMAARQARQNKWNDALVCNTANRIAESSIGNVFVVRDGQIYTPPLEEGCVAGVMRRHLLASHSGIVEQPITREALMAADEVFITNAIKGIKWVGRIGDRVYTHKVAAALYAGVFG